MYANIVNCFELLNSVNEIFDSSLLYHITLNKIKSISITCIIATIHNEIYSFCVTESKSF